jgi:lysophospholipase L1-like esterase
LSVQQTPKARLTYVAIGASDTFGTGTDDPPTQSWPSDLANKLGNGVHLVNLGIPGIHVHEALNVELPVALDSHPDLITVWLAVNDLADQVPLDSYSHDLDLLLSRLQSAAPHTQIVVANVPDLTLLPRFRSTNAQELQTTIVAYNTTIATIVQRHHVLLVDLYQQWRELASHPEYVSSDGFHPNALGYTRVAEIFYQVLQKHTS